MVGKVIVINTSANSRANGVCNIPFQTPDTENVSFLGTNRGISGGGEGRGGGGGGWLHGEQIFCFCFTKGSQVELETSLAMRF